MITGLRGLSRSIPLALLAFVALAAIAGQARAGPVILMGIDPEDEGLGGHGPVAIYAGVVEALLADVTNGRAGGILVVGGGKQRGDEVTAFWDAVGVLTGAPITYANGGAIAAVSFASFAMIAVASAGDPPGAVGGLTDAENALLAARRGDIADFVNAGGGLLGLSQNGLAVPYGYVAAIGAVSTLGHFTEKDIEATPEGEAVGLDDTSLDVGFWHDAFVRFPPFFRVLATYPAFRNLPAAIGGESVEIVAMREGLPRPYFGGREAANPAASSTHFFKDTSVL